AIATSIDALCIGFVYIDYSLINALIVFSCIGVITFIISSLTGIFGKSIGKYIEKWAGLVASIVFLTVGIKILLEGIM
ncbi:MAG TPA: manganese efflux pump MntP, partial [Firmicutes bacterium]|nr:manganese efflux pump MntP [Bacillota bacterium]